MAEFYIRTFDLTRKLLALEKDHQDVLCLGFPDDDDSDDPVSLSIESVCSSEPGIVAGEFIDSDESLADLF